MSGWVWVDVLIVLIAIGAAVSGYRQGAVASALGFVGVILGAVAGIMLAPRVMELVDDHTLRLFLGMIMLITFVVIGEAAGVVLGSAARSGLRGNGLRAIDSLTGSVLQVLAVLVTVWLLSAPIEKAANAQMQAAVGGSKVLGAVESLAPEALKDLPRRVTRLLESSGFVEVMGPYGRTHVSEVEPPDPELAQLPVIGEVRPAVLKINGVAAQCNQNLEGSGFVYAPGRVMTNAHVVAGTNQLSVSTADGAEYPATLVHFDPAVDVAVLHVPDLPAGQLQLGFAESAAESGSDAIALGYPENGPFTVTPLRVRDEIRLQGPDIFQNANDDPRHVYTVRGRIRSGNSGGPMIDRDGRVLGVVFGAAENPTENPADDTGFILTAEEVRPAAEAGRDAVTPVNSRTCVPE